MKKIKFILLVSLFLALCINVFAEKSSYPFDVKHSGTGKSAIVFIPGFACSGEVWDETRKLYEMDFSCYTLTMAGFAGTNAQENASFVNWENGIAKYILDNHIERPILIGHSMGGALALAIAADYPELIKKVIVIDALPCLSALMNPNFKSVEKPDCSSISNQLNSLSDEQFYEMQKMTIPQMLEDKSKHELVISWSVKSERKTFAEMYCDFSNTDLREKIKTIKCPNLILLEAYFKNVKPAIDEEYKNLANANLQYANKGLHFIMFDDKEWYLEQLSKFIN